MCVCVPRLGCASLQLWYSEPTRAAASSFAIWFSVLHEGREPALTALQGSFENRQFGFVERPASADGAAVAGEEGAPSDLALIFVSHTDGWFAYPRFSPGDNGRLLNRSPGVSFVPQALRFYLHQPFFSHAETDSSQAGCFRWGGSWADL